MDRSRNYPKRLRGKPYIAKELPQVPARLASKHPNPYKEPTPSETSNQITRHGSRPCLCGMYGPGGCKWQFSYLYQMILAIHEILPFREMYDAPNFFVTSSRTNDDPTFAIFKTSTFSSLSHEEGPWIESQDDRIICLGCGCGCDLPTWPEHRDSCSGIEDAILRSVVGAWEVEARAKTQH
ncbi:uncharacterized protein EV420DRAFT_1561147 [Desarmillaria tabescens]|uniref:Uncharacterized protein n=1 Tax=Armillaria tabescens TaxID=1929756 RepID=A0AA39JY87_ARMTA|nr:uncharacterized protein EV420DRAFT_1561147 [Desarmillaria tabescens]KAK0451146.1 hypothetical protein EV420DRAFT_1561147 [Desarmillaria tabescens]